MQIVVLDGFTCLHDTHMNLLEINVLPFSPPYDDLVVMMIHDHVQNFLSTKLDIEIDQSEILTGYGDDCVVVFFSSRCIFSGRRIQNYGFLRIELNWTAVCIETALNFFDVIVDLSHFRTISIFFSIT